MLNMRNRFHGHGGVRRVYKIGKPTRTNFASLHAISNEKLKNSKVAVVVSRKVDKSAVKRNRIRRRLYALIRPRLNTLTQPHEIVITVYKNDLAAMPADKLEKVVAELFKKAKL